MTETDLDILYNARATVPTIDPYVAENTAMSTAAINRLDCTTDIQFGPSPAETLDLFPCGDKSPILVYIHGGYWRAMGKENSSFMAENFVGQGISVAAVNYALAPAVSLDEIVRQVRQSIAWIYNNAAQYGIDPDRIHVSGHSAGGHLVGMLAAKGWHSDFGVPDDVIKSVCALSGLFDLRPLLETHINEWIKLDEDAAIRNSPLFHMPDKSCPLILSYAEHDPGGFHHQTELYANAWTALGYDHQFIEMPGYNHFDIVSDLTKSDTRLSQAVVANIL